MKIIRLITLSSFIVAGFAVANAQADISAKSRDFVTKAAMTDMFEIQSSEIALEKSQSEDVKKFAQDMIDDHTKSSGNLKETLKGEKLDLALLPRDLDPKKMEKIAKLKSASPQKFDELYLAMQERGHENAVKLFRNYSNKGDQPALKSFAKTTLPTIEMHDSHVKQLAK